MPIGGKLVLKGGEPLLEKKIKKKKKPKQVDVPEGEEPAEGQEPAGPAGEGAPAADAAKPKAADVQGISIQSGKTYEDEFEFEKLRRKDATVKNMVKNCPWGSSYRAAPEILHGYSKKVTGKTAEERLDMRAATKSDKFAK